MTQQPYPYPQQAPQQPYPQAPPVQQQYAAPAAPQYPGYPQQAPQQYMPGVPAPQPMQPAQPLANGTLDDYFSQPSTGGGPAISWKDKPNGTTYTGVVARDVSNGDISQDTDPQTRQPKFYRDGRPVFVMKVPLQVTPSQEFPDGEASWFVRGQSRDELVRAMTEAGTSGQPRQGDQISITLVERKPGRGAVPKNVFAIRYAAAGGQLPAEAPSPAPAAQPAPQYAQPQQVQQPTQHLAPVPPPQQQAPAPAPAQPVAQQEQGAPQAQPQQPAPQGAALPPGLSPQQQQLFANLTGQQQAG